MSFNPERLISERTRLGLSVEMLASLLGISTSHQKEIEEGTIRAPVHYFDHFDNLGGDSGYVFGNSEKPVVYPQVLHEDVDFLEAVSLLRRSTQAVEAFVGKDARQCPELIAAVMNATLVQRFSPGLGGIEEVANKIADAIESAGEAIAAALERTD